MPVTATPIFTQTPKHANVRLTTANTDITDPGSNVVTLITAGANGSKILSITVSATVTTTAGQINIWTTADATANDWYLYDSFVVPATTASTTAVPFRKTVYYENFVMDANGLVGISTQITETFDAHADYGNF